MQCPECGSGATRVTSTFNHGSVMQRYRLCKMCGHKWKSWEEADKAPVRAKKSGTGKGPGLFEASGKNEVEGNKA